MSALNRMSQSLKTVKNPNLTKKKNKHKKLDEDWFDNPEPIKDGVTFSAKYLGSTLVDGPNGEENSSAAVKRIIEISKASNTKSPKVQLTVSSQGIKVLDFTGSTLLKDVPVHKISFCAAIEQHTRIFSFVAQNPDNPESMECHAYMCNTTKEALALTVTVAQSFKMAFELSKIEEGTQAEREAGSDLITVNGEEKRTISTIKPIVPEKRYQRLSSSGSNPFDSNEENETQDNQKEMDKQKTGMNSAVESDPFFITPAANPKYPRPTTISSSQPIIPLRPPPGRQSDKPSPRRTVRPSSVGNLFANSSPVSVQTPSPSSKTPDFDSWDQGFADLALSRTKEEHTKDSSAQPIYPPSNPFFNPGNPFLS